LRSRGRARVPAGQLELTLLRPGAAGLFDPDGSRPAHAPLLDAAGFEPDAQATITRLIAAPSGLVLVAGPSCSGRSTTAYAMLATLDPAQRRIGTLEARVLRPVDAWAQVHVRRPRAAARSGPWTRRLRAWSTAGPDVIYLGELDTPAVLELSLQSVEAGRLMLARVRHDRACGVLALLRALHGDRVRCADALALIVAQRLLPRLCPDCSQDDSRQDVRRLLAQAASTWLAQQPLRPRRACPGGCVHCRGAGYDGAILAYEMLEVDSRARSLIGSSSKGVDLERALLSDGRTLWAHGLQSLANGATSLEALQSSIREPR